MTRAPADTGGERGVVVNDRHAQRIGEIAGARNLARGNNLDNVRRHNLSLVLGLVHRESAVSRAQLTRATGLNRSTIAALVSELVGLSLVRESEPVSTNSVGRPSMVVCPSDRLVAITVCPELDAVTIALVGLGHRVLRRVRFENVRAPSAREVVNVVSAVIAGMRGELDTTFRAVGIGVAIPGLVGRGDGTVSTAPHLGWRDEPISQMLSESTGFRVWAANDASAGAIAESRFGAGRGVDDMIYLNGGASGIGGGIVSAGTLLSGASGYAGELGHTLVNSSGGTCHCGADGCLETEVSRIPLLDALRLRPTEADMLGPALIEAYSSAAGPSSELAAVVDRQIHFLGIALAQFVNMFNPRMIVLGGFLGSLYSVAAERLELEVHRRAIVGSRDGVSITAATLGPDLLMIGAAELALAEVLADPAGSLAAITPAQQREKRVHL